MDRAGRFFRFLLALVALACYGFLPVWSFSYQGVQLYLMSGFTAGAFFARILLVPLALLLISWLVSARRGRGLRGALGVLGLLAIFAAGLVPYVPSLLQGAKAEWLFANATALEAVLTQLGGAAEPQALLARALDGRMFTVAWGYWVSLGVAFLYAVFSLRHGGAQHRYVEEEEYEEDWDA